MVADPWQRVLLADWLAIAGDGRWAASTDGVSVSRQNGKNGACEIFELYALLSGLKVLHTAHETKTALKHLERMKYFFGEKPDDGKAAFPELNRLVKKIRNVNGQERILLHAGGEIEVSARTDGAGRGFTADVLVCDEAQHMTDDELEALKPTLASGPAKNPKTLLMGTPPGPKVHGEVFPRIRREAMSGSSVRVGWSEWSPPDGADIDDRDQWRATNPGLVTGRLMWEAVEDERASLSDEGFFRERLGRWDSAGSAEVVSGELWNMVEDATSIAVSDFALAVDVSPDSGSASVAFAGRRVDGGWHVELMENKRGRDWVPAYVAEALSKNPQVRAVVVDVGGMAKVLMDDLVHLKVRPTNPQVKDVGVAFERFVDGVRRGEVRHTGQVQLSNAVQSGRKRRMGQTEFFTWNRKDATSDITPVVACTLALWGAQTIDQNVTKPKRGTGRSVHRGGGVSRGGGGRG